jgi:hypothetical protein
MSALSSAPSGRVAAGSETTYESVTGADWLHSARESEHLGRESVWDPDKWVDPASLDEPSLAARIPQAAALTHEWTELAIGEQRTVVLIADY